MTQDLKRDNIVSVVAHWASTSHIASALALRGRCTLHHDAASGDLFSVFT
jgi:hypothetical protein